MKFNRLFGGAATLALAAKDLALDESSEGRIEEPTSGAEAQEDPPALEPVAKPAAEQDPPPADAPDADDQAAAGPTDIEILAHAAGRAEMHERITAVFASEHVSGREAAAAELLAADLASDRIIATLAKLPKGDGGNAMLDALRETASAQPPAPTGEDSAPKPSAVWDRAHDKLGFNRK